jgi:hypothetical protein
MISHAMWSAAAFSEFEHVLDTKANDVLNVEYSSAVQEWALFVAHSAHGTNKQGVTDLSDSPFGKGKHERSPATDSRWYPGTTGLMDLRFTVWEIGERRGHVDWEDVRMKGLNDELTAQLLHDAGRTLYRLRVPRMVTVFVQGGASSRWMGFMVDEAGGLQATAEGHTPGNQGAQIWDSPQAFWSYVQNWQVPERYAQVHTDQLAQTRP